VFGKPGSSSAPCMKSLEAASHLSFPHHAECVTQNSDFSLTQV
jgi:hypothetical protein